MAWKKEYNSARYKKSQIVLALLLLILLILVGVGMWVFVYSKQAEIESTPIQTTTQENGVGIRVPESESSNPLEFDAVSMQTVLDEGASSINGTASVVLMDENERILAQINPREVYFSASIYKLYVAYTGYQQVDAGQVNPEEVYVNGQTRQECLDLMIRDSDSPCAERLWNELGKQELTNQLQGIGIVDTDMSSITTTARDASLLLARILRGEGLSNESRTAFLDSLKDQDALYRRGLPSGFTQAAVFNKVGWNELLEWHDTAIVEFTDGRQLIVSVMTENVGSAAVARLGTAIEELVNSSQTN